MDEERYLYVIDMLIQRIETVESSNESLRELLASAQSNVVDINSGNINSGTWVPADGAVLESTKRLPTKRVTKRPYKRRKPAAKRTPAKRKSTRRKAR